MRIFMLSRYSSWTYEKTHENCINIKIFKKGDCSSRNFLNLRCCIRKEPISKFFFAEVLNRKVSTFLLTTLAYTLCKTFYSNRKNTHRRHVRKRSLTILPWYQKASFSLEVADQSSEYSYA